MNGMGGRRNGLMGFKESDLEGEMGLVEWLDGG